MGFLTTQWAPQSRRARLLGRLPQRGEIVAQPAGYEFEVLEADPRRVKRVRIRRGEAASAA